MFSLLSQNMPSTLAPFLNGATITLHFDISLQLMKVVSFNLGMGLPLLYGGWHCQYQKCLDANVYRVPSLYGLIGYISLTMLCHDVLFYHAHR